MSIRTLGISGALALALAWIGVPAGWSSAFGQEAPAQPPAAAPAPAPAPAGAPAAGINDAFRAPDVSRFQETFEGESREIFAKRDRIADAAGVKAGSSVADVGAGTGLFTRIFADRVGPAGRVYAVDISQTFLDHIVRTGRDAGLYNIRTVLCDQKTTNLPAESVDVAFICDTYHHFEHPSETMASVRSALRPGGRVVVVDFKRVEGESPEWVLKHVRAGREEVIREIEAAGFKLSGEETFLETNYLVIFEKTEPAAATSDEEMEDAPEEGKKEEKEDAPPPPAAGAGGR